MDEQIGAYRIERTLGRGGFGVVYVGVDDRLGRRAAIKMLLPAYCTQREFVERFFREARAAASIDHPGIVEIYDVGWHTDGSAYFAMKLLDGDSLAKRLRARGMLPISAAIKIARQVASAVAAAHARGIVHRDLKPDNIVVVADAEVGERAIVLDFGIAKLTDEPASSHATSTGAVLGTPLYMSPEQCRGAREVDHRTDVYALGCIVFEMLAGRPPFSGTVGEVVGMHQFVEPPRVASLRPDLPPALDAVVARALAKEPAARFQTPDELAEALAPFAAISTPAPAHAADRLVDPHAQTMGSIASAPTAPSAPPPSPSPSSPSPATRRRWPYVAAGVIAIAGVAVVIAAASSTKTREVPIAAAVDASPTPPDATVIVVAVSHDAAASQDAAPRTTTRTTPPDAGPVVVASNPPTDLEGIRRRCRELETARDWPGLRACIDQLRNEGNPADKVQAETYLELVMRERNAQTALDQATDAIARGDFRTAHDRVNSVPADAFVRPQAVELFTRAEQTLVTSAIAAVRPHVRDCDAYIAELKKLRRAQGELFSIAVASRQPCTTTTPLVVPENNCDAERHAEGDVLLARGAYAEALSIFEHLILECRPTTNHMPVVKVVVAACRSKNAAVANRHFEKLVPLAQVVVARVCRESGVTLRR